MTSVMSLAASGDVAEVVLEAVAPPMPWSTGLTYGIGRAVSEQPPGATAPLVLAPLSASRLAGETVNIAAADLVLVPAALDVDTAMLAPVVARALWLWDAAGLELGDLAVVTAGHPMSGIVAAVAGWYGAEPLTVEQTAAGEAVFTARGTAQPAEALPMTLKKSPGVAAAELSGSPDLVDVLLEALPPLARVVLAGVRREPLTIDFYVNVHRKGLTLLSGVLDPRDALTPGRDRPTLDRAFRLLERSARAAECQVAAARLHPAASA